MSQLSPGNARLTCSTAPAMVTAEVVAIRPGGTRGKPVQEPAVSEYHCTERLEVVGD